MTRACPLCRESAASSLFAEAHVDPGQLDRFAFASRKPPEYMHHRLLLCRTCDLVYASPVPDDSALHTAYEEAAFDSQVEAGLAAKTYARVLQHGIAGLPDRSGALDIGTGDGAFLAELLALGFTNVRGIEPSTAPVEAAKPAVRGLIDRGFFEAGRYEPGSLALITCFQTIEHVAEPLALVEEASRLLKPGGVVCLVGHNRRALSARVLGRKSPIYDIEHLQLFSPASLHRLLTRAGLRAVRVAPLWNRYPLSYWTRLFPLPMPLKLRVLTALTALRLGRLPVSLPAGNLLAFGRK